MVDVTLTKLIGARTDVKTLNTTANRITKIIIALLFVAVVFEGYLLRRQAVSDAYVVEAVDAVGGLSNAAVLAAIRRDITEKQYDSAVQRIDGTIRSAIKRYRQKKGELHFVLPGENEALKTIEQDAPMLNTAEDR